MPQSLIRTSADAGQPLRHGGALLIASHEAIVTLLRSRLGSNQAELLAKPRVAPDGSIAWSTGLAGPVVRGSELGEEERADLQRRCDRFTENIRALAAALATEGWNGAAWSVMVERALVRPAGDWLFSVDDRPVLAMWGHVGPSEALPPDPLPPVAAPVHAAASPVSAPVSALAPAPWMPTPAQTAADVANGARESRPTAAPAPTIAKGGSPANGAAPHWLPPFVAALGIAALALVGVAAWRLAAAGLLPGFGGVDDRIAAAESRNAELQSRLQSQPGNGLQCRRDDPPPSTGQGAASPPPSPSAQPATPSQAEPAAQGRAPGAVPTPAAPDRPAPMAPEMPKMPLLPKFPDVPNTTPAPGSLQLPPNSSLPGPSGAEIRLAQGGLPGLLPPNPA